MDSNPSAILLDVREETEYSSGHAIGAVLLSVQKINTTSSADVIPTKDTPVLVYCHSGMRSRRAAETLEQLGYTVVYDIGSITGWPYGIE